MKRFLGLFLSFVMLLSIVSFIPAFEKKAQALTEENIISENTLTPPPTPAPPPKSGSVTPRPWPLGDSIPPQLIDINIGSKIVNPYGRTGASIVRINIDENDPVFYNKTIFVKGTPARYTYYNGIYMFVAFIEDSVAASDIAVAEGTPQPFLYGDLNGDGELTSTDMNLLKGALAGNRARANSFEYLASDVNGDGEITSTDMNMLKGFLAGNLASFPVMASSSKRLPSSGNHTYLVAASAGHSSGLGDNYQLRVFTKEGQTKIVSLFSNIRVYYNADESVVYSTSGINGKQTLDLARFLMEYTKDTVNATSLTETSVYTNSSTAVKAAIDNLIALRSISPGNLVASKVVDIAYNEYGYVSKISFPNVTINDNAVTLRSTASSYTLNGKINEVYNANTKSFGNKYHITDSTKIFYIPADNQLSYNDFELRQKSSFIDDLNYNVKLFNLDYSNNIGLILLTEDDRTNLQEISIPSLKYMNFKRTTYEVFTSDNPIFYYWIDPDNDISPQEAHISRDAVLFVNGTKRGSMDTDASGVYSILSSLPNGRIKLLNKNKNADDLYDTIYVTTYLQGVVQTVDPSNQTITFKAGELSELSFSEVDFPAGFTYTLKDKDGININIEQIGGNDVIAVAFSDNSMQMQGSQYMDVIVLKDEVTGVITEKSTFTSEYYISGEYYKASNSNPLLFLNLEDNGTFLLDIEGKIIYRIPPTYLPNYAYLVQASDRPAGINPDYQLRIFTKEGHAQIVTLASSVRVYYDSFESVMYTQYNSSGKNTADLARFLVEYAKDSINASALTATDAYMKGSPAVKAAIDNLIALRSISSNNLVASKVVDITCNEYGYVTRIVFPNVTLKTVNNTTVVDEVRNSQGLALSANVIDKSYASDSVSFNHKYNMTDATKVFYIPEDTQTSYEDFELRSITSFTNGREYTLSIFNLDENYNAGLVLLTKDNSFPAYSSRLALVDRIGMARDPVTEEVVDTISVVIDGKDDQSYRVAANGYRVYDAGTFALIGNSIDQIDLTPGDAIQFTVNYNGSITAIAKIFSINDKSLLSAVADPADDDKQYVFAKIYNVPSWDIIRISSEGRILPLAASANLRFASFDQTLNSSSLASTFSGQFKVKDNGTQCYIVSRIYRGRAYDLIQYKFRDDGNVNLDLSALH